MTKIFKQIFIVLSLIFVLILPCIVFAGTPMDGLQKVQENSGYQEASKTTFASNLGTIVQAILGFLGIIFLGLTIYGGFKYMTAAGNQNQVDDAIKTIRNAIIGLILVMSAYGIYKVVAVIM